MYGDPIHPDPSSNLLTSWPTTPNGQCSEHGAIAFATNGKSSSWMMRILKIYQNMSYSGRRSSSILWVVFLTVLSPPRLHFLACRSPSYCTTAMYKTRQLPKQSLSALWRPPPPLSISQVPSLQTNSTSIRCSFFAPHRWCLQSPDSRKQLGGPRKYPMVN